MSFAEKFNARSSEIGHGISIQEKPAQEGPQAIVFTLTRSLGEMQHVRLLADRCEAPGMVQVLCSMDDAGACDGLTVYATAIDALCERNEAWRNGVLKRLGLFDGKFGWMRKVATQSGGWSFAVQAHSPAKGILRFSVCRNRAH